MTFRNILRKTSFSSIFNVLYKEFYYKDSDDETVNTSVSYRRAIAELLSLKSREALSKIHLYTTDAKPYIEVCLVDKNGEAFALDLTLWEDLIDCEITTEKKMSEVDICAHILYEITFYGYSCKQILDERKKLLSKKL